MAKTKTPFLSLGSQGSIGDSLTSQKRGRDTVLRRTPKPTDPYSLPQAYQRWLYEDYTYLWTQQTAATKQSYATAGSRHHLTGFQYWMKYNLKNLPDIAGMWHLDEKTGSICHDYSRNANHGTIVGPSPVVGCIDGGYFFDGINDRILLTTTPSLDLRTAQTLEFLIYAWDTTYVQYLFNKGTSGGDWIALAIGTAENIFLHSRKAGVGVSTETPAGTMTYLTDHHLAFTLDPPDGHIFLDGHEVSTVFGVHPTPDPTALPTYIGCRDTLFYWTKAAIDHVIYYNRVLDSTEIKRHSLRRYQA